MNEGTLIPELNPGFVIPLTTDQLERSKLTLKELKETIKNLEKIYKEGKYTHARIVQVANVLKQRLRVINTEDKRYKLIEKYVNRPRFCKKSKRTSTNDKNCIVEVSARCITIREIVKAYIGSNTH